MTPDDTAQGEQLRLDIFDTRSRFARSHVEPAALSAEFRGRRLLRRFDFLAVTDQLRRCAAGVRESFRGAIEIG